MATTSHDESDHDLSGEITQLLQDWRKGDHQALHHVIPALYDELRGAARYYLTKESANCTMQPTALVHEVYVQLMDSKNLIFQNREHFFRCACLIMRRTLVQHARSRLAIKRGNGQARIALEVDMDIAEGSSLDPATIVALDEILSRLEAIDPRKSQIVELRYFTGLTVSEIADVLETSTRTVEREWSAARRWLAYEFNKK